MNCAICGKDNQAGTRFCVHCGAALAAPASGSRQSTIETAGAILAPKPPSQSPSGGIPSTQNITTGTIPPYAPRPASAPPPAEPPFVPPEVEAAPAVPAYNADPKKAGWLVIVIAAVGVLAVLGYFGYKVMRGGATKDTLTRIETPPPKSTPAAPREPSPPGTTEAPKTTEASPPPVQEAPAPPPESQQPRAVAPTSPAPKTPRASSSGQSTSRQPVAQPSAPVAPAPAPQAQARPAPPAPVPAAAPLPDRWAQFAEDLHRCERETFLSRVVCDQRVRIRYCDGYWGKVPQCPGGVANPDR
jgi:hypothetical protein